MFLRVEKTLDCSVPGKYLHCLYGTVRINSVSYRYYFTAIRYYPEVLVMDPFSLEVLFTLSSRVNPDWISALHVLRPAKRKGRFYVHTS